MTLDIFPLDLGELSILFALTAITLLVTSEMLSSYRGRISILIDKKRLRRASVIFAILFLVTVGIKIYSIISTI